MKIVDIQAMRMAMPREDSLGQPRRDSWHVTAEVANPMSRYPKVKAHRSLWLPE